MAERALPGAPVHRFWRAACQLALEEWVTTRRRAEEDADARAGKARNSRSEGSTASSAQKTTKRPHKRQRASKSASDAGASSSSKRKGGKSEVEEPKWTLRVHANSKDVIEACTQEFLAMVVSEAVQVMQDRSVPKPRKVPKMATLRAQSDVGRELVVDVTQSVSKSSAADSSSSASPPTASAATSSASAASSAAVVHAQGKPDPNAEERDTKVMSLVANDIVDALAELEFPESYISVARGRSDLRQKVLTRRQTAKRDRMQLRTEGLTPEQLIEEQKSLFAAAVAEMQKEDLGSPDGQSEP